MNKRSKKIKFIQSLDPEMVKGLKPHMKKRAIELQEMLRAVVIPEWLDLERVKQEKRKNKRRINYRTR